MLGTYIAPIGNGAGESVGNHKDDCETSEVIEMRHNTERFGIRLTDLIYFALGILLLLLFAIVVQGQ